MFYGKGGYDWETVYNMPIWLRRFTFNSIKEFYDKEKEEYEKEIGKGKSMSNTSNMPKLPHIPKPTYSAKAAKKY